ncbi:MAG: hypothetical protein ACAI44_39120 [Candidatus Sericytochromatia bacterium]
MQMIIVTSQPQTMSAFLAARAGLPGMLALLIVVLFKSSVFAWLERKHLPAFGAFGMMLLGNLISTVMGFFSVMAFSSSMFMLVGSLLACACALIPARRLQAFLKQRYKRRIPALLLVVCLWLMFLASTILFLISSTEMSMVDHTYQWWVYWLWKLAYVLVGVGISLFLSALWEEWMIHLLYRNLIRGEREDFIISSLRANLYSLLLVGSLGAILALPERLRSPNFLIWLWQSLASSA